MHMGFGLKMSQKNVSKSMQPTILICYQTRRIRTASMHADMCVKRCMLAGRCCKAMRRGWQLGGSWIGNTRRCGWSGRPKKGRSGRGPKRRQTNRSARHSSTPSYPRYIPSQTVSSHHLLLEICLLSTTSLQGLILPSIYRQLTPACITNQLGAILPSRLQRQNMVAQEQLATSQCA